MRKGTLTIVDSDESYLWEEDAEDAQPDIEVTPYIERKLAKYGCGWKYLPDIDYWLLVGPVEVLSDGTGGMGSTGTRAGRECWEGAGHVVY